MARDPQKMSMEDLEAEIAAVDEKIGEQGEIISKAKSAQRRHLDRKDGLVLALTDKIRASGPAQTLGDDRG